MPHPKGAGPQHSPIWRVPKLYIRIYPLRQNDRSRAPALASFGIFALFMPGHRFRRTTKFDVVSRMGERHVLDVSHAIGCCMYVSHGLSATADFFLNKCENQPILKIICVQHPEETWQQNNIIIATSHVKSCCTTLGSAKQPFSNYIQ